MIVACCIFYWWYLRCLRNILSLPIIVNSQGKPHLSIKNPKHSCEWNMQTKQCFFKINCQCILVINFSMTPTLFKKSSKLRQLSVKECQYIIKDLKTFFPQSASKACFLCKLFKTRLKTLFFTLFFQKWEYGKNSNIKVIFKFQIFSFLQWSSEIFNGKEYTSVHCFSNCFALSVKYRALLGYKLP